MHLQILSDQQRELLPFIAKFRRNFYLVGGTAIALHIGHRRSIDYSESVEYLSGFEIAEHEIKDF